MLTKLKSITLFSILLMLFSACQKDNNQTFYAPTANAETNQNIQLPISSVTLTGTGHSNNGGTITGYLWSLISGPNVPIIVSPSSASTTVNGLVAGTYILQFMVVDNLGYTGVAKDTLTVLPIIVTTKTLILQPANNPNEANISSLIPTDIAVSNYPELPVQAWTNGNTFAVRVAIKFDLSALPSTSTIISAKLTLYSNPTPINGNQGLGGNQNPNYGTNNAMNIQRITANWSPTSITWNNKPAIETTGQVAIPHTNQGILDLTDLDVTTMVAKMQANNYGFMFSLQNETPYNIRNFCSSKYQDTTKHPKLVISYQ